MEKIKNFLSKLEKLPSYALSAVIVLTSFYSQLATQLVGGDYIIEYFEELLSSVGGTGPSIEITPAFLWITAVIGAFVAWGILELGIYAVPQILRGRGYMKTDLSKFKFAARIGYIATNLIIGSFSFIVFWRISIYNWTIDIASLLAYLGVYTLLFLLYRKDIFNGKHIFDVYKFLFSIYFVYKGVISGINFVQIAMARDQYMLGDLIFSAVQFGLVAVTGLLLGVFLFAKLQKEQTENRAKIEITVLGSPDGTEKKDIFKDYGI